GLRSITDRRVEDQLVREKRVKAFAVSRLHELMPDRQGVDRHCVSPEHVWIECHLPAAGRRGRCLADTDFTRVLSAGAASNADSWRATACAMSALTSGVSMSAAFLSRTPLTCLPSPSSRPCGSRRCTPWLKKSVTHLGYPATD